MFPDPCGDWFAEEVRKGADPKTVVPDDYVVVHGGAGPLPPAGVPFSGATGPTLETAAAAVPHGKVHMTTAGAIRAAGGSVEWKPEISLHKTVNQQHVDVIEIGLTVFSPPCPNPVPRRQRIDGDKKRGHQRRSNP